MVAWVVLPPEIAIELGRNLSPIQPIKFANGLFLPDE
jgi:hypothetical protein